MLLYFAISYVFIILEAALFFLVLRKAGFRGPILAISAAPLAPKSLELVFAFGLFPRMTAAAHNVANVAIAVAAILALLPLICLLWKKWPNAKSDS